LLFEDLRDYEAGNNNKRTNKKNAEWLRRIVKRTFEKSLWNYSKKVLTYLPIFNKNQRNLEQILVKARNTSIICNKCGSKGIKKRKEFICKKCGLINNIHINASKNIAKKLLSILEKYK